MPTVFAWPPAPPADLSGFFEELEQRLLDGTTLSAVAYPGVVPPTAGGDAVLIMVNGTGELDILVDHLEGDALDVVAVVDDSYLGSDSADLGPALTGGAAVAAVRSKATRRQARHRANVVVVPAALMGRPASQRGPLAHVPDASDAAEAAAFLLDPRNGYLNGQVVHVTGGRHLFSSQTA